MKNPLVHRAAILVSLNASSLFCIAFLAGCNSPARQNNLMGGATEYITEAPSHQVHHRTADDSERPVQNRPARTVSSHHVSTTTASANPSPAPGPKRKVESEIRDSSELRIDDETRQRMDTNGVKTDVSDKKSKPRKVEAEVRDASNLQIDEQTKKAMDKPQ